MREEQLEHDRTYETLILLLGDFHRGDLVKLISKGLPKNYPACSESIRFRYILTRNDSGDAD
jgi:hypothetical protein